MSENTKREKPVLVTRSSMPEFEEYAEEIKDIWDSAWLTNFGKKHNELQEKLSEYLGVKNISLLVNGHMSLELCLQAMGLEGEVITTPFTFVSTTHAIIRNGLTPVFADIKRDDYTIDPASIEKLITDRTCAIVPVHVYGNICDVEAIEAIAKKHGLKVIYDAAHAFGVTKDGVGAACFGDASMFSFHATKVFHTIEGGAIASSSDELMEELHSLKDFGIRTEEIIDGVGANGKMNEFCAAMGLCNLRHVDGEIAKRKLVAERYRSNLSGVKGIKLSAVQEGVKSNYAYFPAVFEDDFGASRDEVQAALKENNIFSRKYFYPLTNSLNCFEGRFDPEETPVALDISKRVLTLPMAASLPLETVDEICRIIIGTGKN